MFIDELESEGKLKVAVLQDRYETWIEEENFRLVIAEAVASGVEDLEYNGGALLLHHIKKGGTLDTEQWNLVIDALSLQMHWTCKLSLCQVFSRCSDALAVDSVPIAAFLRDCIDGENDFARAWGISAFWSLAERYSDYVDEAIEYKQQGERDEAKCVQARMRQLKGKL